MSSSNFKLKRHRTDLGREVQRGSKYWVLPNCLPPCHPCERSAREHHALPLATSGYSSKIQVHSSTFLTFILLLLSLFCSKRATASVIFAPARYPIEPIKQRSTRPWQRSRIKTASCRPRPPRVRQLLPLLASCWPARREGYSVWLISVVTVGRIPDSSMLLIELACAPSGAACMSQPELTTHRPRIEPVDSRTRSYRRHPHG